MAEKIVYYGPMENTLSALTLKPLIDHSIRMALKNYKKFALPIAIYYLTQSALVEYISYTNPWLMNPTASGFTPEVMDNSDQTSLFLFFVITMLIAPLYRFLVVDLSISSFFMKEEQWTLSDSLKRSQKAYVPLLIASFLSNILIFMGVFVFIIGSLVVFIFISLIYPILVFEGCSTREAFMRSFKLVGKDFFPILGSWIIFGILLFSFQMITTSLIYRITMLFFNGQPGIYQVVIQHLLSVPLIILTLGVLNTFTVNLYLNQRIKKEEFGLEQ